MAILKHIASKNADYGEAQRYLMFQYNEDTMKPILDENGRLIPRDEYYLDGINCNPFSFDMECKELNAQYCKNQSFDEIKSHHYRIKFTVVIYQAVITAPAKITCPRIFQLGFSLVGYIL